MVPRIHYLARAWELRAILQWKLLHGPSYKHDAATTHDLRECWRFLSLSSRSFVAVIRQLHPELLMPICIFYLALRSLDTIEDDMTIAIELKEPLLREFHEHLHDEWTFDGSGPDEHDRDVLVGFDCVSREYNKLKDDYRVVIKDITQRMGDGMADYAIRSDGVNTTAEYERYCHYVAGLVGEGVTRMFIQARLADPVVMQKPDLAESMAQLLQQTNIIRDVHEDHEQNRHFWPKEIWSKHVEGFSHLFRTDPSSRQKALACSSEMVLQAINNAPRCLAYMAGVREQSIFNFVAIPQAMAMATLELCFQNPAVFQRNVKITKGSACDILIDSTKDFRHVAEVFRKFARQIQRKNALNVGDPNFDAINTACEKIYESIDDLVPTCKAPWTDKSIALHNKAPSVMMAGFAVLALLGIMLAILPRLV